MMAKADKANTGTGSYASIDELLKAFAVHMIDTMWEGKDISPRLAWKNRQFRKDLDALGYGEVICEGSGYATTSKDGLHKAYHTGDPL